MQTKGIHNTSTNSLIKLDPRTKLYLMLMINIIIISGDNEGLITYIKLFVVCIPFVLLLTSRKIAAALLFVVLYSIGQFVGCAFIFMSTTSIAGIIIRMLSQLICRFAPCVIMGFYLISTTRVSEFIASMEKMHLSQNFIIPFLVMFRFFPTISEEYHDIQNAMRMRGIGLNKGPVSMMEYRFVPLVISLVKIGDELSAAALTRGLGSSIKRSNLCKIGFGFWDFLFISIVTIEAILWICL